MLSRVIAVVVMLAIGGTGAIAETRALVVGVDDYDTRADLSGSVNDARDLEDTLKRSGLADVTTLVDGDATRARFDAEWNSLVDRAGAGDVLFLSFSGHGILVPDKFHGQTAYGSEKGFLLQPYDQKVAPDEILRDEDLYDRFAVATAKGLKVFFVVDACHAGRGVRDPGDPRAKSPFRFQVFSTVKAQPAVLPPPAPAIARPANPNVTVFSANKEGFTVREVIIDGVYRGALSYAVARGLEALGGRADGVVDVDHLRRSVSSLVTEISNNRQIPQFLSPQENYTIVKSTIDLEVQEEILEEVTVRIVEGKPQKIPDGVKMTNNVAEITWDMADRLLIDTLGDWIATDVTEVNIQDAVDVRRAVKALRSRLARQSADVGTTVATSTSADYGKFMKRGEELEIHLTQGPLAFAVVVDLTASGQVQLMWPIAEMGDPPDGAVTPASKFGFPVTAPFGADHIVTIRSERPLVELLKVVRSLHNNPAPGAPLAFFDAFVASTKMEDVQIGINSLFSCYSLSEFGKCELKP